MSLSLIFILFTLALMLCAFGVRIWSDLEGTIEKARVRQQARADRNEKFYNAFADHRPAADDPIYRHQKCRCLDR